MSIDIHFSAARAEPLSPGEQRTVEAIVAAWNARRPLRAGDEGSFALALADLTKPHRLESAARARARGRAPDVLVARVQLQPTDDWTFARLVIDHVCGALSELRAALPAERFSAWLDDTDLAWDDAAKRYAAPASLTEARWKESVAFTLGSRRRGGRT